MKGRIFLDKWDFLEEGIFKREKFEWRDFQREKLDSERVLRKAIPSENNLESSSIDSNIMSTQFALRA